MTASEFMELHKTGNNTAYYYKKNWIHLFPKNDEHNYSNASLYLTYIHKLRQLVADTMIGKQAIELSHLFKGKHPREQSCIYVSRLYMTQERNSIRQTVIDRHIAILEKYGVEYKHLQQKFKGL